MASTYLPYLRLTTSEFEWFLFPKLRYAFMYRSSLLPFAYIHTLLSCFLFSILCYLSFLPAMVLLCPGYGLWRCRKLVAGNTVLSSEKYLHM